MSRHAPNSATGWEPVAAEITSTSVSNGPSARTQRGRWAYYAAVPGAVDRLAGSLSRAS